MSYIQWCYSSNAKYYKMSLHKSRGNYTKGLEYMSKFVIMLGQVNHQNYNCYTITSNLRITIIIKFYSLNAIFNNFLQFFEFFWKLSNVNEKFLKCFRKFTYNILEIQNFKKYLIYM